MSTYEKRIFAVWLLLSAITLLSWSIGAPHGEEFHLNAAITFSVIIIAGVKIRIIMREFMEVREAPPLLRYLTDAWLFLAVAAMLSLYVIGTYVHFSF